MYNIKNIFKPSTLEEASKLLLTEENSMIIGAGTDVLIQVREGRLKEKTLISVQDIPELHGIKVVNGDLHIGAFTSFTDIQFNEDVLKLVPTLSEAVATVGGPQIRNLGTIGGNVCNGVTSADAPPTLFAYNATLEIFGPSGLRYQDITDFYISFGKVKLDKGEILTRVIIKAAEMSNKFGHYIKYAAREAMDVATSGCSVILQVNKNVIEDIRIGFASGGPIPMRAYEAEKLIKGKEFSDELVAELGLACKNEVNPHSSWDAQRDFRLQITHEISMRAFKEAYKRAGGVI
jgi:xanthine dehydrogenase FAD-binding subunit